MKTSTEVREYAYPLFCNAELFSNEEKLGEYLLHLLNHDFNKEMILEALSNQKEDDCYFFHLIPDCLEVLHGE